MNERAQQRESPDPSRVMSRALMRAAERLGVSQKDLAEIIGLSPSSVSRLGSKKTIAPDSKEGQLALLFLRVFRSLDAIVGGNEKQCQAWLSAENTHLHGVPLSLMKKPEGLVNVIQYLDAMRGKL